MDITELQLKHAINPLDVTETQLSPDLTNSAQQHDQLKAAAKNFEGIFIKQIIKQMQETIENASFDPDDNANQQVHGMYCTFLGDMLSQRGGFGLWENIYEQMVRMEGGQNGLEVETALQILNAKA
jgi:Rod binding domain-containing protein